VSSHAAFDAVVFHDVVSFCEADSTLRRCDFNDTYNFAIATFRDAADLSALAKSNSF